MLILTFIKEIKHTPQKIHLVPYFCHFLIPKFKVFKFIDIRLYIYINNNFIYKHFKFYDISQFRGCF